jgi:predicted small lipoprotein YifL
MKIYLNCLCLLTVLGVAGCGQPGPLYLPGHPPPGLKVVEEEDPEDQSTSIPEREIDEAPPPIDAAPPKPVEPKTQKANPPTENPQ